MRMASLSSKRVVRLLILLVTLGVFSLVAVSGDEGAVVSPKVLVGRVGRSAATHVSLAPRNRVKFGRSAEVSEKCPALTPRDTAPTSTRSKTTNSFLQMLPFRNGDWEQEQDGVPPVIPFEPEYVPLPARAQLASFWITDVDSRHDMVSGLIELVITDGVAVRSPVITSGAGVQLDPGYSFLSIEVEGIYQPTVNEDVVCMLGCTFLPVKNNSKRSEKTCNIMVQLHYPLTFNLTSRIVRGSIQSLDSPEAPLYFSPISLSSQVSGGFLYEASANELVSTACTGGAEPEGYVNSFNATIDGFCELAAVHLSSGWLDIEPNWKCNNTEKYCSKIGPFASFADKQSSILYNNSRAQILVQNFQSQCFSEESTSEIPVSFVLRLVPGSGATSLAEDRSALNGQTLVAEGYWKNGSDVLCMVGCRLDDASGQPDLCNSRISLRIPTFLSITSRNIFEGRISSLLPQDHPDSFFPLAFHFNLGTNRNFPWRLTSMLRYNYTMLDQAESLRNQYEPDFNGKKASWLKYPSLIGEEVGHYQSLAEDLSLHYGLKGGRGQTFSVLDFEVVSIDEYLPFLWSGFMEVMTVDTLNDTIVTETDPDWKHHHEGRQYLNFSGTMSFSGFSFNESTSLIISTEGYYSPKDGKMYMVGCRSVKASWVDIEENVFDLNEGLDCEIEILLEYPNTMAAWLLSPTVKVKVHSRRPADDLFHFVDIDTETYPILYRKQREEVVSQKSVEGALSILTLSLMLICIISQLLYVADHVESTPYMSLVMVGIQAMGYAIPLVTGAESLLTRKFDYRRDYFFQEVGWTQIIIYLDKILTLVALLFLVRLFEKVWRERAAVSDVEESVNVPHERSVVVICFIIHAVGFLSVIALHSQNSPPGMTRMSVPTVPPEESPRVLDGTLVPSNATGESDFLLDMSKMSSTWQKVLQEYAGLVEDLFLLPQAIAFSMWEVNGKPLRLSFYLGLTLLQIVPHAYDHLRDPGFDGDGYSIYANPSFDFYTNMGNVLIPILALVLAFLVYIQQRWNGCLRFPKGFLYEPLGGKNKETELVGTNGRSHLPPIPEDDE